MKRIKSSSGGHTFAQVPKAEIQRSTFNRSHGHKTTFNSGLLIPIFVDEALPGDTFSMKMQGFARLATPLKPLMDNLYLETFFFAVPNRLVWENFKRFMGEEANPGEFTDFVTPVIRASEFPNVAGSIYDYMGIPLGDFTGGTLEFQAMPFRAYNLIWNEFFRDQNLQGSVPVPKAEGPDSWGTYQLLRRGKRHDYFTSSLPWPQKGDSVSLPLGTEAPIFSRGAIGENVATTSENTGVLQQFGTGAATLTIDAAIGGGATLWTDLSDATAASINELRQAFQVQRLLERNARGGTRYTEVIKAHFNVTSPDARLQRPEYLGGGSTPIVISPIAQTSGSAVPDGYTPTPQGNLAAMGTASWSGHSWTKSFTEHSIIIGLACVRADLTYQQGVERMWSRRTRYDFYWPALSHIGEQAVLSREIYADGTSADDDVWGYQERFAEYRYKPSRVSGVFRSTAPESLDVWHLAQEFATRPTLSDNFIQESPPIQRVIAVQDEPEFIVDMAFDLKCARPMPVFGVPGLIDHF